MSNHDSISDEENKNNSQLPSSENGNCKMSSKNKPPMKIRLVRVFSSSSLKSPRSSTNLSPSTKFRYSWQLPFGHKDRESPRSPKSDISSSPKSTEDNVFSSSLDTSVTPQELSSTMWYVGKDYEVLATATTTKGKEVGIGCLLNGSDAKPGRSTSVDFGRSQKFLVYFVKKDHPLPFSINRDVRLDARLSACLDASSSRLLEPGIRSVSC